VISDSDIRGIALSLPEAYEDTHRGVPAFRIQARIFAMLSNDAPRLIIKLEREDQLNMMDGHPGVVVPGRHYSHHGWTRVDCEQAGRDLAEILLKLAWTHVAPKRLAKAYWSSRARA
jgi:hypothetical protein